VRRLVPLLALVALAAAPRSARPDGAPPVFLEVLDLESAPGVAPDGPLRATLELHPSGAGKEKALREWFPGAHLGEGRVSVILAGRAPEARRRRSAAHRSASFLVDFDGPAFAAIREELLRRHGPAPAADDLARFVDAWIDRKSSSRGIDVASTVATRREGDCTEHAVLLAALARLVGRDARVVIGIALVPVDGALRGFGHAWAEIHDGRGWRTVDATPLPPGVRYLPLAALGDEGPGYLGGAWAALSPIHVRRVALAPAPAGARP
jgi:transglutaminase-like putative cysteine protease